MYLVQVWQAEVLCTPNLTRPGFESWQIMRVHFMSPRCPRYLVEIHLYQIGYQITKQGLSRRKWKYQTYRKALMPKYSSNCYVMLCYVNHSDITDRFSSGWLGNGILFTSNVTSVSTFKLAPTESELGQRPKTRRHIFNPGIIMFLT